jgi:hypothetical protein
MLNWTTLRFATLAFAASLSACSGNGQGLDAGGRPLSEGGGTSGPLVATFDSIQSHVFTPVCTVCHAGGAAPQGLRLDATNSYALLVGVPSNEVSSVLRVDPGHPDQSYVIQKLEGHAAVGAQMPFGGPPLPAATIAVIRQWITDGAAKAPAAATAPFAVVAAVPARGEVVLGAPARVVVAFSRELDQTRLDADSIRVERVSAAGVDVVPATLRMAHGAPATLLVEPARAFGDGHYRVIVPGPPATGVAGLSGERLPSAPDGAVVSEFDVVEMQ